MARPEKGPLSMPRYKAGPASPGQNLIPSLSPILLPPVSDGGVWLSA